MFSPAPDEDLSARQAALQAEAAELLAQPNLAAILADAGPVHLTGSYVSGLQFAAWLVDNGYPDA